MTEKPQDGAIKGLDKLYEFEREPVSEGNLQPGRYFAGSFAGEHVAGTEFVIGALFVSWGVSAYDVLVGLLIGNLMAVLTWTLVCVPIAVSTRLTLYWYLRKIAGPVATATYNVLNAILFCILAGCMITVAASAVRIPFGIPAQVNWYPQDLRFVLVVLVVGAVVVTLAILGFKRLAQFATVCSPWMLLMFLAGATVLLPGLAERVLEHPIGSAQDLWILANEAIWIGATPDGKPPMTFWQVAAFAWICNLAMHAGLSDMALFRYARRTSYGLYSAFGMFLGHYLAWICAGIMGAGAAIMLGTTIIEMDAGGVAWEALGVAGIIAVVIAGWTTSNPTMYRAGLAFQAVTPNWPRWLVTLAAGVATTVIACFPFVFTRLLDFVGWYGLLLMPVGAIVFTEHWIFPKIGMTQYWASHKKLVLSWPALLSWGIAIAAAFGLQLSGTLHLFFLFVPVWILTSVLYIVFASMAGARQRFAPEELEKPGLAVSGSVSATGASDRPRAGSDPVLLILRVIAVGSLLACVALPLWVYLASPEAYSERLDLFKKVLLWPTLIYFVSGTIWAVKQDKAR